MNLITALHFTNVFLLFHLLHFYLLDRSYTGQVAADFAAEAAYYRALHEGLQGVIRNPGSLGQRYFSNTLLAFFFYIWCIPSSVKCLFFLPLLVC